jgi:hypothetical protein
MHKKIIFVENVGDKRMKYNQPNDGSLAYKTYYRRIYCFSA